MHWTPTTVAALCVFTATYLFISLQKIKFLTLDRPSASLGGAVLMIAFGVLTLKDAYRSVSYDTLVLLLGMMIVVAYLKLAGFFEWTATWILLHAKTPGRLLWMVVFASGLLSAFFVNDTICLLFTPILLEAVLRAKLPPAPYLIALVTSANIGSAMTLTGNPQNMLVGIFSGIPFGKFLLVMAPIALLGLAINALLIALLYRGRLGGPFEGAGLTLPAVDRSVLRRVGLVLVVVLTLFLLPLHEWMPALGVGQNLPFAAVVGASLVILFGKCAPARAMAAVDWPLLLFFACMFVVVDGVNRTGLLGWMYRGVHPAFGSTAASQAGAMTGFSIVASNLVSNVPFVMVAQKWMGEFAAKEMMWFVVAMSSTFAGNLTIVGSVANMIVMEQSKDRARVGFLEYMKVGVPVTLATSAVGLGMLLVMHRLGLI